jgi:hypothetical protein
MSARPAAVEIAHPPQAVLRVINPLLRAALRAPLLGSALKDFMIVTFTGRKTGRRFAVPVSAHHINGELYVLLNAGWKHNFRDGAPAEVRYGGSSTAMTGQLITDSAVVAELARRAAVSYGARKAQRSMGLKFRDGEIPTAADFAEASNRLGLAAIRLTPAA